MVLIGAGAGTVANFATISAGSAAGDGVDLQQGGRVANGSATDTTITGAGYLAFTLGDTTARGGSFGGGGL